MTKTRHTAFLYKLLHFSVKITVFILVNIYKNCYKEGLKGASDFPLIWGVFMKEFHQRLTNWGFDLPSHMLTEPQPRVNKFLSTKKALIYRPLGRYSQKVLDLALS